MSRLALANCRDLLPLIQWNRDNGIHFFRIPSALFPWSHEYELEQLPGGRRGAACTHMGCQVAPACNSS